MTVVKQLHLRALYKAKRYESLWHFLDVVSPHVVANPEIRILVLGMLNTRSQMTEVAQYAQRLWPLAEIVTEFASSFASSRAYRHSDFVVQIFGHRLGQHVLPHAHVIKCPDTVAYDSTREFTLAYREP